MQEVKDIQYRKIQCRDELHLSGGIRGMKVDHGWMLGPVFLGGVLKYLGPFDDRSISKIACDFGVVVLGGDEIFDPELGLQVRVWHSLLGEKVGELSVADAWALISFNAEKDRDIDFAKIAKAIALSLHAADIRLRDISDEYHCQLSAALSRNQRPGLKFSNIRISNLHVAFHSFMAELGSARDYICKYIGQTVGAPDRIDSFARIIDWMKNRAELHSNVIVGKLISSQDGSLCDLGEYRNIFLHRQPIGVFADGFDFVVVSKNANFGDASRLNMLIPSLSNDGEMVDALDAFVSIYKNLLGLARAVALESSYSTQPRAFYVNR